MRVLLVSLLLGGAVVSLEAAQYLRAYNVGSSLPLMHTADLVLECGYRAPSSSGANGVDTLDTGGGVMIGNVYDDPTFGKTLFIGGQSATNGPGTKAGFVQVSFPATCKDPTIVGNNGLDRMTVRQGFADLSNGQVLATLTAASFSAGLVYSGKIIGYSSLSYDGSNTQTKGGWVAPLDFTQIGASATGLYHFSETTPRTVVSGGASGDGSRFFGGTFMAAIPSAYQGVLGGDVLSGNGPLSIIASASIGPSLHVINAAALAAQPSAATTISGNIGLGYYLNANAHDCLGRWDWDQAPTAQTQCGGVPYFNITDPRGRTNPLNGNTSVWVSNYAKGTNYITGALFPQGYRSVIVFGSHGMGIHCYGDGVSDPSTIDPSSVTLSGSDASTDGTGLIVTLPNKVTAGLGGGHLMVQLTSQTTPAHYFGGDDVNGHPGMSEIQSSANSGAANANVTVEYAYTPNLTSQAYKVGDMPCKDPESLGNKGTHAYPYTAAAYAFDVNDLIKVKNGTMDPWDLRPYEAWPMNFNITSGSPNGQRYFSVAYDAATNKAYFSVENGEGPDPTVFRASVAVPMPLPSPFPIALSLAAAITLAWTRKG